MVMLKGKTKCPVCPRAEWFIEVPLHAWCGRRGKFVKVNPEIAAFWVTAALVEEGYSLEQLTEKFKEVVHSQ